MAEQIGHGYHRTDAATRVRDVCLVLKRLANVLTDPRFREHSPQAQVSKARFSSHVKTCV